jgi:HSP20 family protein
MNIVRWEPLRELDEFFHRYSPSYARSGQNLQSPAVDWTPAANISETSKEYVIKTELPEMKKEDVKVTFLNGVITIAGERKQVKQHEDENDLRIESFYGTFSRSFALPNDVDEKAIRAESQDGVLRVHIPKRAAPKPQHVEIKVQ